VGGLRPGGGDARAVVQQGMVPLRRWMRPVCSPWTCRMVRPETARLDVAGGATLRGLGQAEPSPLWRPHGVARGWTWRSPTVLSRQTGRANASGRSAQPGSAIPSIRACPSGLYVDTRDSQW
jgi:hypothetical protein